MNCSETEIYLKEKARMTKSDEHCHCSILCVDCPLSQFNNKEKLNCYKLESCNPDKAISIVQKWSDEHPPKTYKDDFFEKFPNAFKNTLGEPMYCRKNLYEGADSNECHRSGCTDCWNEIMEVTK